jgi:hypothetical protein
MGMYVEGIYFLKTIAGYRVKYIVTCYLGNATNNSWMLV